MHHKRLHFSSTFWALILKDIPIWRFEESQNSFLCGCPCNAFWFAQHLLSRCAKLKIVIFVVMKLWTIKLGSHWKRFLNPFLPSLSVWYPLKTPKIERFSGVFKRCKIGTLARNRLTLLLPLAFNTSSRRVA